MGKLGHGVLPAESLVEHDVQRSTRQPFLATNNVRNLHQVVINDIGQVVGGQLVGTLVEHLVIADVTLDAHLATDEVIDQDFLSGLHLEAHHVLVAFSHQPFYLFLRKGQRVTHLLAGMAVVLEVLHLLAFLFQFLWRVEGNVCLAVV